MQLQQEHLEIGERIEHTRFQQLREFDHRPEYQDVALVPSESSESVYLVATVECLAEPFHDDLDASEARIEVPLCSCDDGWYHQTAGFEGGDISPEDFGRCKHHDSV